MDLGSNQEGAGAPMAKWGPRMAELKFGDVVRPTERYLDDRPEYAGLRLMVLFVASYRPVVHAIRITKNGSVDYRYGLPNGHSIWGIDDDEMELDPEWPA